MIAASHPLCQHVTVLCDLLSSTISTVQYAVIRGACVQTSLCIQKVFRFSRTRPRDGQTGVKRQRDAAGPGHAERLATCGHRARRLCAPSVAPNPEKAFCTIAVAVAVAARGHSRAAAVGSAAKTRTNSTIALQAALGLLESPGARQSLVRTPREEARSRHTHTHTAERREPDPLPPHRRHPTAPNPRPEQPPGQEGAARRRV